MHSRWTRPVARPVDLPGPPTPYVDPLLTNSPIFGTVELGEI